MAGFKTPVEPLVHAPRGRELLDVWARATTTAANFEDGGGMVRSIALGPAASEEETCCNSCGAPTEAGGPSLVADHSRLAPRDTFSLEQFHRGVSEDPTLAVLPDLITSCVADESAARPADSSTACPWSTCRHRAKVVGRRLRFLCDSLDKRRLAHGDLPSTCSVLASTLEVKSSVAMP
ncbi:uncharacterized protein LOC144180645 [Haemaphysalis longicornis]